MSSFGGRRSSRGRSYRGRGGRYGSNGPGGGRGGGYGGGLKGKGGDSFTFDICRYFAMGDCQRGNSCYHAHKVQRLSEEQVSARNKDGSSRSVHSLLQWKAQPNHVFTACDDGTVKMWSTADGAKWNQVTSVEFHKGHHTGALRELLELDVEKPRAEPTLQCNRTPHGQVDGRLFVGYGMPWTAAEAISVDAFRIIDLASGASEDIVDPDTTYAHSARINCIEVVRIGADVRVFTGGEDGKILAWQVSPAGGSFQLVKKIEGHIRGVTSLIFVKSNGMLWSSSRDSVLRIWNAATCSCEHSIAGANDGHTGEVVSIALVSSAAEGTQKDYIVSAGRDGFLRVWSTEDASPTYKHACGEGVSSLATFDPVPSQSTLLLVGYEDGTIAVRNFPEFALAFELHPNHINLGHTKSVYSLLPINNPESADSYFLSAGEEGKMICWKIHELNSGPGVGGGGAS